MWILAHGECENGSIGDMDSISVKLASLVILQNC